MTQGIEQKKVGQKIVSSISATGTAGFAGDYYAMLPIFPTTPFVCVCECLFWKGEESEILAYDILPSLPFKFYYITFSAATIFASHFEY
jgi:hypothetical protein